MEKIIVRGERRLQGSIAVQGAKNSVLPVLAASVLCDGPCTIHNCPLLRDVEKTIEILRYLGCGVRREGNTILVDPTTLNRCDIPDHLMREMRSSVIFLGAILARTGEAHMSYPGGCELGPRPIDLHIGALRELGTEVTENGGHIHCRTSCISGGCINLSFPSVGATENAMLAASACKSPTRIINAAMEPEIIDLQNFLCAAGADVRGAGTSVIEIRGFEHSRGVEHTVIPDRIAAVTYLCAAATAGGSVKLMHCMPQHLLTVISTLEESGCRIRTTQDTVEITRNERLHAVREIRTMPYPGFPTDAQALLMSAMATAQGSTVFVETIFENRFRHVGELERMGANIKTVGRVAVVSGVEKLTGARVNCTDLRGGAALVLAALGAAGESEIHDVKHIDRGYENFENCLSALGADIVRR